MDEVEAPPRRRRKEARPQELLDAALAVFVEKGFAAARSEEVAARAGVSKGTLYLYYPSKHKLLEAVIAHHLSSRIAETSAAAAAHQGPVAPRLREVLIARWRELLDSPASAVLKLIVTEVRNFPEIAPFYQREVVEPTHALLGGLLRRGIAQGEFRAVEVDDAVHSLLLPLLMLCLHRHSLAPCQTDSRLDPHRFIAAHVGLVLDGLRAPAAASPSKESAA